ncbi:MAG: hypothetical protein OXI70_11815 [Chloroflexota bacterium]|nr:hypothetical protein [Chloroflexota bacterium]
MNLACWAVPIRDGYVLRADRSTAAILQAAPARSPQFWGWRIALIQPQSQQFSAPLAARAAVMAVDYARLAGGALPEDGSTGRGRIMLWMEVALGLALIIASGGHWVPALAGTWLLAGPRGFGRVVGLDGLAALAPTAPAQQPLVSSDAHAGLGRIERAMREVDDDSAAYALGAVKARADGLDEVAEVYEALAEGAHPSTLPPHIGFWVADETLHNPWRLALPAPTAATGDAA